MRVDPGALFLSLRPQYAEALLCGHKTVELRRVRPTAPAGTMVLLYASSPAMTLVGKAEVGAIRVAPLDDIWRDLGHETAISRSQYDDYFAGLQQAVAISLLNIRRLPRPRPLDDLRHRLEGFRPPQSYRYLSKGQVAALI